MSDAVPSEKGALQSFGWMLVCDERAAALTRHSGNLEALFPDGPGAGLGANLRDIVGGETAHLLRNALSRFASPSRPALLPCRPIAGCDGLFDLSAHFGGDETIIEIERAAPDSALSALDRARTMIDRIQVSKSLEMLAQRAVRLLFSLLQYDRTAIYRRNGEGDFRLLAEQRRPGIGSCDPTVAGVMAADLWPGRLRVIADIDSPGISLHCQPGVGDADLSFCALRAASRAEEEALRAEALVASLALGLFDGEDLWGVALCQSHEPRAPDLCTRAAIEVFGDFLALQARVLTSGQAAAG